MNLSPLPIQKFFANNGRPLAGGLLFTYAAGTSTPIATYSDADGTLNTNPIVLDFRGEARVWLDPDRTYKFILSPEGDTTPPTNPILTVDKIAVPIDADDITQQFIGMRLWPQTQAERDAGVTPTDYAYPEGYVLRYGGVVGGSATTNTIALNNATKVCAYGKAVLQLPPSTSTSTYDINGTWDCTYAIFPTVGLTIRGNGMNGSFIRYIGGANNSGIGWDQTGANELDCKGFSFQGGVSITDCPKAAVLMSAGNNGGNFVFAGVSRFEDVNFVGYGDHVIYNAGCEQLDFFNCLGLSYSTSTACQPYVFVASGSIPTVTSDLVTTYSPVRSMTIVKWHGKRATNLFWGSPSGGPKFGVVFHFTAATAGACSDINFDGYFNVTTANGTPFKFMADDSSGFAGTALYRCGGRDITMESGVANGDLGLAEFNVAVAEVQFSGLTGSATTITANVVQFNASCVPTNCHIDWAPNIAGGWSGSAIANIAGHENGIYVRGPVSSNLLVTVANDRTIDGLKAVGYAGEGTDYNVSGVKRLVGPTANVQFNFVESIVAGNQSSASSRNNKGVQTTQGVTTSAVAVCTFPNTAAMFFVTGISGAKKFMDIVTCLVGGTPVVSGAASIGGADARTYTYSSGSLNLQMAADTYNVQVLCQGLGTQE